MIRSMNPFTNATLAQIAQQHGTPVWVYDAATITAQVQALGQFDVVRFAQKANERICLVTPKMTLYKTS